MRVSRDMAAELRIARFEMLVSELRPLLRRSSPHASETVVLEHAIVIATRRLAGGTLPWNVTV